MSRPKNSNGLHSVLEKKVIMMMIISESVKSFSGNVDSSFHVWMDEFQNEFIQMTNLSAVVVVAMGVAAMFATATLIRFAIVFSFMRNN